MLGRPVRTDRELRGARPREHESTTPAGSTRAEAARRGVDGRGPGGPGRRRAAPRGARAAHPRCRTFAGDATAASPAGQRARHLRAPAGTAAPRSQRSHPARGSLRADRRRPRAARGARRGPPLGAGLVLASRATRPARRAGDRAHRRRAHARDHAPAGRRPAVHHRPGRANAWLGPLGVAPAPARASSSRGCSNGATEDGSRFCTS